MTNDPNPARCPTPCIACMTDESHDPNPPQLNSCRRTDRHDSHQHEVGVTTFLCPGATEPAAAPTAPAGTDLRERVAIAHVYRVSEIRDGIVRRIHGYYASLRGAFVYCEGQERTPSTIPSARFELLAAPGGDQWMVHSYFGPDDDSPEISDLVIARVNVIADEPGEPTAVHPAPADRVAVLREAAARIDSTDVPDGHIDMFVNGAEWATAELRRMADEAQPQAEPDEQQPTPLRWGLNDVMWGDDDTTTIMLSGPNREPYWLELDPERASALRDDLAGPYGEAQQKPSTDDQPHHQLIARLEADQASMLAGFQATDVHEIAIGQSGLASGVLGAIIHTLRIFEGDEAVQRYIRGLAEDAQSESRRAFPGRTYRDEMADALAEGRRDMLTALADAVVAATPGTDPVAVLHAAADRIAASGIGSWIADVLRQHADELQRAGKAQ